MPGRALPSRYSRLAPPPVEMWPKAASSKPSGGGGVTAADDRQAVGAGQRVGDRSGAVGELRHLEHAHRTVPEDRPGVRERSREVGTGRGTDVEAEAVGRDLGRGHDPRLRGAVTRGELAVDDDVAGQQDLHPELLGPREVGAAGLELVLLEEALADLVALGLEEGEDHAPADEQLVGLAQQVVDHAELVGDLGATEHDDVRTLRLLGEATQHVDLGRDQRAHGAGQDLRDVVDAGLLAVHDPEAVGDEDVGEVGELPGEPGTLAVVLAGLARVEADVLQQGDLPVLELGDGLVRRLPHRVAGERDVGTEELTEASRHGSQGVALLGGALGAAEVRGHHHAGARVREPTDRRHARADAPVVGDDGSVERDVEVGADQDPLAGDALLEELVETRHRTSHAQRDSPTKPMRSTRRLE
jgi:hypothetical protein